MKAKRLAKRQNEMEARLGHLLEILFWPPFIIYLFFYLLTYMRVFILSFEATYIVSSGNFNMTNGTLVDRGGFELQT